MASVQITDLAGNAAASFSNVLANTGSAAPGHRKKRGT